MIYDCIIFIDNGVTGSMGIIGEKDDCLFTLKPVVEEQSYTKAKKIAKHVDTEKLKQMLLDYKEKYNGKVLVVSERPMINPGMFSASISAAMCYASELSVFKETGIPYSYCDSKDWQKKELPSGVKGSAELKKASMDIGMRLFPQFADLIRKHKDADGILGAKHFYESRA